jgi:hypothetical protein
MLDDDARTSKHALKIKLPSSGSTLTIPIDLAPVDDYDITSCVFQTDVGTIEFKFTINGTDVEWSGGDETLAASSTAASETTTSAYSVDTTTNKPLNIVVDLTSATSSPAYLFADVIYRITG